MHQSALKKFLVYLILMRNSFFWAIIPVFLGFVKKIKKYYIAKINFK